MSKELKGLIKRLSAKVKRQYDKNKKEDLKPSINEILTDQQVENWRKVLCLQLGPYAFIMPKEEIQKLRNKMQRMADSFDEGDL